MPIGETIENMAEAAIEALRAWKPHGPYAIGGYSVGGAIAIEMATRLRRAGERIEALVLLDPSYLTAPPREFSEPIGTRLRRYAAGAVGLAAGVSALLGYRISGSETQRLRLVRNAYQISTSRYRPEVYDGPADLLWSEGMSEKACGIRQALPNGRSEHLPFEHLDVQWDPDALKTWGGRVYALLKSPNNGA